MSINNIEINRIYRCCNKKCEGMIQITQKATEDFLKACPFCHQDELVIETAKLNLSFFIDANKPKTFGAQSDLNTKHREQMFGKKQKSPNTPWYRKSDRVDFKILRDPHKYITEGKI